MAAQTNFELAKSLADMFPPCVKYYGRARQEGFSLAQFDDVVGGSYLAPVDADCTVEPGAYAGTVRVKNQSWDAQGGSAVAGPGTKDFLIVCSGVASNHGTLSTYFTFGDVTVKVHPYLANLTGTIAEPGAGYPGLPALQFGAQFPILQTPVLYDPLEAIKRTVGNRYTSATVVRAGVLQSWFQGVKRNEAAFTTITDSIAQLESDPNIPDPDPYQRVAALQSFLEQITNISADLTSVGIGHSAYNVAKRAYRQDGQLLGIAASVLSPSLPAFTDAPGYGVSSGYGAAPYAAPPGCGPWDLPIMAVSALDAQFRDYGATWFQYGVYDNATATYNEAQDFGGVMYLVFEDGMPPEEEVAEFLAWCHTEFYGNKRFYKPWEDLL